MLESHGIEVDLQITNRCPLTCDHCVYDSKITEGVGLPFQLIERLCADFEELNVEQVSITGGEPFLRKDLTEIVSTISSRGIEVCVQTSGLLGRKANFCVLRKAGLHMLLVSIDGPAAYHERFRHRPGLFQDALDTIEAAREADLVTRINAVVMRSNLADATDLLDTAEERGVGVLSFFYFSPVGRGARFPGEVLTFSQWQNLQDRVRDWCRDHPNTPMRVKVQNVAVQLDAIGETGQRCRIPDRDNILILANGDVYPCVFLCNETGLALGNVHHQSLVSLWRHSERWISSYTDLLSDTQQERDCGGGRNPQCSGGCPAFRRLWRSCNGFCDRRCEWSTSELVPSCAREYVLMN